MAIIECTTHAAYGYYCRNEGYCNWSEVWNATTPSPGVSGTPYVGYYYSPARGWAGIFRACFVIDTTAILADAVISQVVLKGTIETPGIAPSLSAVSNHLVFYRATGIDVSHTLGAYRYIRDCTVELARTYFDESFEGYAFEALFGAVGIASIVKGGYTNIAARVLTDTSTAPAAETTSFAWAYVSAKLEVTYDVVPGELVVVTLPATEITKTTATLNGEITSGTACKRGFDWGIADAMDNEWYEEGTFGIGAFSHDIEDLTEDTEYCFRAKAEEAEI